MAAIVRPGLLADGTSYLCYSIVMQPAPAHLADLHDRMPLLIPAAFAATWLTADPGPGLIDAALAASQTQGTEIAATGITKPPA